MFAPWRIGAPTSGEILDPPLIAYSLTLQYFEPIQKDKIDNMVKTLKSRL